MAVQDDPKPVGFEVVWDIQCVTEEEMVIENVIYLIVFGLLFLGALFLGELAVWIRDRIRWMKWFSQ